MHISPRPKHIPDWKTSNCKSSGMLATTDVIPQTAKAKSKAYKTIIIAATEIITEKTTLAAEDISGIHMGEVSTAIRTIQPEESFLPEETVFSAVE